MHSSECAHARVLGRQRCHCDLRLYTVIVYDFLFIHQRGKHCDAGASLFLGETFLLVPVEAAGHTLIDVLHNGHLTTYFFYDVIIFSRLNCD